MDGNSGKGTDIGGADHARERRREKVQLARTRLQILHSLESALEAPMAVLGMAWLILVVIDLAKGLGRFGSGLTMLIWVLFVIDFLLRFSLAPRKTAYLKRNWLTAVALFLPAFRILRFARLFRYLGSLRGLQLLRIMSSINRSMKALGRTMRRRGFGYVVLLTLIVTFAGAAGMLSFEKEVPNGGGLHDFWTALWWTAMIVTTMGSEYWPKTPEGRMLCLFLAVYAFAVFSYVTGTIATYFIGRDAEEDSLPASDPANLALLAAQIAALREEVRRLSATRSDGVEGGGELPRSG